MAITALLAASLLFLLFYQQMHIALLLALSAFVGVALLLGGGHSHQGVAAIDSIAQGSALQKVHRGIKVSFALFMLCLCVASSRLYVCALVLCICALLTVWVGKLHLHDYLSLLSVPLSFLLVSSLALLFEVRSSDTGLLSLLCFGHYLCLTVDTQQQTLLLCVRAMGALSCLYFLSLSTTMAQLIAQCRACKVPSLVIELMYLMYRYIFLLSEVHRQMYASAQSRLGLVGYRRQVKTVGLVYRNLLAQSFRRASACFDAMESRAYTGKIEFLASDVPVQVVHLFLFGGIALLTTVLAIGGVL